MHGFKLISGKGIQKSAATIFLRSKKYFLWEFGTG